MKQPDVKRKLRRSGFWKLIFRIWIWPNWFHVKTIEIHQHLRGDCQYMSFGDFDCFGQSSYSGESQSHEMGVESSWNPAGSVYGGSLHAAMNTLHVQEVIPCEINDLKLPFWRVSKFDQNQMLAKNNKNDVAIVWYHHPPWEVENANNTQHNWPVTKQECLPSYKQWHMNIIDYIDNSTQ